MRLVRYGAPGEEQPGLIDTEGRLRDLGDHVVDIDPAAIAPEGLARLGGIDIESLPLVDGRPRLGPVLDRRCVGKIICIGLNYSDHAKETGNPIPEEPILFMKATSAITGPFDPVRIPRGSTKTDWEVELGVVIGRKASYVDEANALDHVAGYTVVNDVSERSFQLERGGQWTKGKSCDSFAPLGPWLVTRDEVPEHGKLRMWLDVDGERRQDGTTETMIFDVATSISYISQMMSLEPGDIICTGTPPGVGSGMKPPVFLKAGQLMKTGIEGLGEQATPVIAWNA